MSWLASIAVIGLSLLGVGLMIELERIKNTLVSVLVEIRLLRKALTKDKAA